MPISSTIDTCKDGLTLLFLFIGHKLKKKKISIRPPTDGEKGSSFINVPNLNR